MKAQHASLLTWVPSAQVALVLAGAAVTAAASVMRATREAKAIVMSWSEEGLERERTRCPEERSERANSVVLRLTWPFCASFYTRRAGDRAKKNPVHVARTQMGQMRTETRRRA